jgi:hypothetical protein
MPTEPTCQPGLGDSVSSDNLLYVKQLKEFG